MKFTVETCVAPRNGEIITNPEEALKTSGRINHGFMLAKGDEIIFPDDLASSLIWWTPLGDKKVYHISVVYNGKQCGMPIGSLRRMPHKYSEVLADHKVNLDLLKDENDYERLKVVFGKTLVVADVKEFDRTIYDAATNRAKVHPETGERILEKAMFPIFELK